MIEGYAATGRRSQIIDAAIGVFLRYGYARTTMGDIAQAAGLTRPTLYLTFPDKESIFEAVVQMMIANKLAQIRQHLEGQDTIEEKLRFACDAWAAEGFDLVQAHPDASDMFDLGFKSVCAGYGEFGDLLAEIIEEPLSRSKLDLSPQSVARAIVFALRGFKDAAVDGSAMRNMIAVHVAIVAAALDPDWMSTRSPPRTSSMQRTG